jgi:hypothetical protein
VIIEIVIQVEEERYANKVIEYFNAGILKLDEAERGITLRAYLAQKLGCDPMRITKKYTGASCLGKRVYHALKQNGKCEEVDNATTDLLALEEDFRARLLQMNKRRGVMGQQSSVSTPAIDSMFKQTGFAGGGWIEDEPENGVFAYPPNRYIPSSADASIYDMQAKILRQQYHLQQQQLLNTGTHSSGKWTTRMLRNTNLQ